MELRKYYLDYCLRYHVLLILILADIYTSKSKTAMDYVNCWPSITETEKKDLCRGDLIFEDNFKTFDDKVWECEKRLPSESGDNEFVTYMGTPTINNGGLVIEPEVWDANDFRPFYKDDTFELGDSCTNFQQYEDVCTLTNNPWNFVSPIVTSRINTRKTFSFKYGKVEIFAKLPIGDWLVPLLLLEPTENFYGFKPYQSGQLRIAFARGNTGYLSFNNTNLDARSLFGGAILSVNASDRHRYMINTEPWNPIGNEPHIFTMTWIPDEIRFELDGYQYGSIEGPFETNQRISKVWRKRSDLAPFDQKFHITLGLSVGGFGDFPQDDNGTVFWNLNDRRAKRQFFKQLENVRKTWRSPNLEISYIRVWAV